MKTVITSIPDFMERFISTFKIIFVQSFLAGKIASNSIAHHKIEIDWYIAFLTAR